MLSLKNVFWFFKWAIIMFVFFLAQLFLMPIWSFNDVVPNLLLVLIIVSSFKFGLEAAFPTALVFAYFQSLFLYDGFFHISWLIMPFIALYLKPNWNFGLNIMIVLQVILGSFYAELINSFFYSFSYGLNALADNYWILLLSPILNGLLALPIIFILDKVFSLED